MRVFSILTAVFVAVSLIAMVVFRDQVFEMAGRTPATADTQDTASDVPKADGAAPAAPDEVRRVSVVARQSAAQSVDSAVILRGETEAVRQVVVMAETSGRIVSVPLRKGARVEEGQLLCELDPGTRNANLMEAQAALAAAEVDFRAAERLTQDGYRSESSLAQARAALQSAQSAVERVEIEIERLRIHAPFSGILESDTAELGALMQPGSPCATVIQLSTIKIVGFLPEAQVHRVTAGAPAGAELIDGTRVTGRVTFLSRSADPTTRTFRVEIEVDNSDLSIRDGQTAEIAIASEGRSAHLLPQSALTLSDEGRLGVRTVEDDDKAGFAPVSLVRDTPEGVWLSGLPDEVAVITVGQEFVTDGVPLHVTYEANP